MASATDEQVRKGHSQSDNQVAFLGGLRELLVHLLSVALERDTNIRDESKSGQSYAHYPHGTRSCSASAARENEKNGR